MTFLLTVVTIEKKEKRINLTRQEDSELNRSDLPDRISLGTFLSLMTGC